MARRTPSWILEAQLEKAKAREKYYNDKNKNDATFKDTVDKRPRMRVGYRSLLQKVGTTPDHAKVSIFASEKSVKWFEGVAATGELLAGNARLGLEYVNLADYLPITKFKPCMVRATLGGNPTPDRTEWGTRYIKYSASSAGGAQAHYNAPLSIKRAGAFVAADVEAAATAIAAIAAIKSQIGEYGRLSFELERSSQTLDTD